jgi:ketosteroid isomerase-like protein
MRIVKILTASFISGCVLYSCQTSNIDDREKTEIAVRQAEKDFETMAIEKNIAEAFWYYADSNAVIKRQNDTLIHGREGIKNYYSADYYKTASVKWSPDFVESSLDGTMAYTYGKYTWQFKDSSGKVSEFKGVFHTVWKKQNDGSWKYVWD